SNTYNLIGYAYMLIDKPVSAENAYRQAMLLNRNDKSAMAGLARTLLAQKRYNECIYAVKELLKEEPRNKDLWYILTNCYSETGQIKEAIKSLETANIISDENYSSFITLGDLYLMNEQSDYAAANYHKAFKQQGANPKDIVRAASNLFDYGNTNEAYRIIENHRKKISTNTQEEKKLKLIEAGIFINQQKLSQAEKILINLAENYPLDSSILIMNGDLYLQQKQYEKAILYYERAERTADDKSQALIRQAKVEVERENYNRAAELLENAQKLNPQPYIEKYLNQVKRFAD
ncbi:MAG: tetratricopeptide repeat protein, partial [Candidatus Muiribacteriota bacterium]